MNKEQATLYLLTYKCKDIELLKDTLENSNLYKSNKNLYWSVWKLINAIEKQGVD